MPYKGCVRKRTKHEPTDSYFYLAIHIVKCMVRSGAFDSHAHHLRREISTTQQIPISHVFDLVNTESKGMLADEKLSRLYSIEKRKSVIVIVDESYTEESKY